MAAVQQLFNPGQDFLTQLYPAALALRNESLQRPRQTLGRVRSFDHQLYLRFPALVHVPGQLFELLGLLEQMAGAAQQGRASLGQLSLASDNLQQRDAQLLLHPRHGVADRRLGAVQHLRRLGKAAMIDYRLQGSPLLQGDAWCFHLWVSALG